MKTSADELLEKIDIVDVVSRHVKLRRTGRNHTGLCPFHNEKKPSFTVNAEKQMFYCFGCKEGGDAIAFIMKYENLTFFEALDHLGWQYGIEIDKGDNKRTSHYDVLEKLCSFYQTRLAKNRSAREYLERRGISDTIISEFKIGYSMGPQDASRNDIHTELDNLIKSSGIPADIFLSTGVVRLKDGNFHDMFGGRVIIPIIDVNKRVIGFGGRTLDKDGIPKYVNSPESSVFSKRNSLFGIDKTKKHIIDQDEVLIVEGYFDLISLYRAGIKNVVSTLGTSVTEGQITKLRNYTENITLMLDGDPAGVKSALRLIGLFAQMNVNGNMAVLPENHDPDSFIRENGPAALMEVLKSKKPILDFYFDYYFKKEEMATIQGKQAFINQVMPHISAIVLPIKRQLYIKRLSELTGVGEEHFGKQRPGQQHIAPANPGPQTMAAIEKNVINVCLSHPNLLEQFRDDVLPNIKNVNVREILTRMTAAFEQDGKLEARGFAEQFDNEDLKEFFFNAVFDIVHDESQEPEKAVSDYIRRTRHAFIQERSKELGKKASVAEESGDLALMKELLEEKRFLEQKRQRPVLEKDLSVSSASEQNDTQPSGTSTGIASGP